MAAVATYVHGLGEKFGMYVTPGIPVAAYNQNPLPCKVQQCGTRSAKRATPLSSAADPATPVATA
jgi:hypothetical protein